jgi:hypothetical protein
LATGSFHVQFRAISRKGSGRRGDPARRQIIERAVSNGKTEVEVCRFPNQLCTDRGRAINQQEPGWENTLTGLPKEIYDLWARHFRERGYTLRDFPGGMPGDIGTTLKWS